MSATLRTGPVWRCAPSGTEEVYLVRVRDSLAQIQRVTLAAKRRKCLCRSGF
jgi:hypothetical protein